jgi:hypothetical protein
MEELRTAAACLGLICPWTPTLMRRMNGHIGPVGEVSRALGEGDIEQHQQAEVLSVGSTLLPPLAKWRHRVNPSVRKGFTGF